MDYQKEIKLYEQYLIENSVMDRELLEKFVYKKEDGFYDYYCINKADYKNEDVAPYLHWVRVGWGVWVKKSVSMNDAVSQAEITSKPIRVSQKTLCFLLDIKSETLRKTIKEDPDFPKPIKKSIHQQGSIHYDYQEILNWHEGKKSEAYKKHQEDAELNAIADSRKGQKRISVNIDEI